MMRWPREVVSVDPERREIRFTVGSVLLGIVIIVCGWPAFYGVLWFAASAGAWAR